MDLGHVEWLRDLMNSEAHFENLTSALTTGRLLKPDLAPLLADMARGWVSAEDSRARSGAPRAALGSSSPAAPMWREHGERGSSRR
jgi:hypothetical protein